jgi:tetratricopeptide (TPR) repeat protein
MRPDRAGPAYEAMGRIERERGHRGEALADFYEAAARLDNAAEAYNQIGEIYLDEDLPAFAAEAFERALAVDPVSVRYNYNLAVAFDRSAPERAADQWRRYMNVAAGQPTEKKRLAEAAHRLRDLEAHTKGDQDHEP